ncbi:MAG: divergent polysaccharide deacetylase family protein [Desulfobacterales bacterium]|nr:divergent polysaccharide deacetylase family protein [Desulfobacterales bacterium]
MRGGVHWYVAQAIPQIDAEIAEKGHFWMETSYDGRQMTTIKKRARVKKKFHSSQEKLPIYLTVAIVGLSIFAAVSGYGLYRFLGSHRACQIPIFESVLSQGTEASVKQIDRRIYDALLALNIHAGEVVFRSVETRRDKEEVWTFSEMEIHLSRTVPQGIVESAFYKQFSALVPTTSLKFYLSPNKETIISCSVNGRQTHSLIFVTAREKKPVVSPPDVLPMVAIIIDDLGYDEKMASKFLELDAGLSFSVLPHSPFQKSIAAAIHRSGRDVLLHLPMEPLEYPDVDPGEGTLLCSMYPDELLAQLKKNLGSVPLVVGVNNHMGSRFTQDSAKMRQVFTMLKMRNLFFIDSFTNPGSHCAKAAKLLQVKFARRDVFLDHAQDPHSIRLQIKRLLTVAKKKGWAIGIGHPYRVTLEVLREELPNIEQEVNIVRVSQLVS